MKKLLSSDADPHPFEVTVVADAHPTGLEKINQGGDDFAAVLGDGTHGGDQLAQRVAATVELAVGVERLRFHTIFDHAPRRAFKLFQTPVSITEKRASPGPLR